MQAGRLVKELPRKAKIVGEGAQGVAIAEGAMVPLPRDGAAAPIDPRDALAETIESASSCRSRQQKPPSDDCAI
jgi:hypothetical protein